MQEIRLMKITEFLRKKDGDNTPVSFELLPPMKGKGIESIYRSLDRLMEFNPPFINVTYHRSEYIYKKMPGGFFKKVITRKRPGTVGICAAIMNKYGVQAVPHLTCGGFTIEETEDALIDLDFLGVKNVLAIRGDAAKSEARFTPETGGHAYSSDLVKQIANMNKGIYLEEDLSNSVETDFCIGVGGYPEKHFEAPNMNTDLKHLKQKVDMGADFIMTQMFFDNQKFFDFVKACREMDINVPIIPGLKPLTKKRQSTIIPSIFHVDIPDELEREIEKCKDDKAVEQVGMEWCVEQSKELIKNGIPCLHFYTMSQSKVVSEIVKKAF